MIQPRKDGEYPCCPCLKLGMRLFHRGCNPTQRQKNYNRFRQNKSNPRKERPKPTFPPTGKDRTYPLDSYSETACKECVREDVKPALAELHEAATCYRRPGGECDKAGPKRANNATTSYINLVEKDDTNATSSVATTTKPQPWPTAFSLTQTTHQ